jgi:hypothetical protein
MSITELNKELANPSGRGPVLQGSWPGKVAVAPTSISDKMFVTIDDFAEGKQRFGPCYWTPQGSNLPVRGDKVLVQFDSNQEPWVVMWIPQEERGPIVESATPPANPTHGQLWILPAEDANGVLWPFRYNALEAGANKWEAVGPSPMRHVVINTESTNQGAGGNFGDYLTTLGPTVLVPRLGQYRVQFGLRTDWLGADGFQETAVKIGTAAVDINNTLTSWFSAGNSGESLGRSVPLASITVDTTAGRTIKMQYYTNGISVNFLRRWLEVFPIRIQ